MAADNIAVNCEFSRLTDLSPPPVNPLENVIEVLEIERERENRRLYRFTSNLWWGDASNDSRSQAPLQGLVDRI